MHTSKCEKCSHLEVCKNVDSMSKAKREISENVHFIESNLGGGETMVDRKELERRGIYLTVKCKYFLERKNYNLTDLLEKI